MIALIVAYAKNRVIGNKGCIPWNIEGEQKRFKELTTNNSGTITKYQLNRLKVLAKACEGWNLDEFEVIEDEV